LELYGGDEPALCRDVLISLLSSILGKWLVFCSSLFFRTKPPMLCEVILPLQFFP